MAGRRDTASGPLETCDEFVERDIFRTADFECRTTCRRIDDHALDECGHAALDDVRAGASQVRGSPPIGCEHPNVQTCRVQALNDQRTQAAAPPGDQNHRCPAGKPVGAPAPVTWLRAAASALPPPSCTG